MSLNHVWGPCNMHLKLKRTPSIYITSRLCWAPAKPACRAHGCRPPASWEFVDLDTDIEEREKDTVANIFANRATKPNSAVSKPTRSGAGCEKSNAACQR